ncbi:GNAT family N-acetyltransferase, partial [Vibrio parahaemolyticus]
EHRFFKGQWWDTVIWTVLRTEWQDTAKLKERIAVHK